MDVSALISEAQAALGLEDAAPLVQGGQKIVLQGSLGGAPAIAKIVPLPPDTDNEATLLRAHREVELLAAIDSDHVVKVLTDAVEVGDPPIAVCWVEEFLDGEDLGQHLGSPWDEDSIWRLLVQMALALEACHDLEVVHRDLSPGNVRRKADGSFVLMDPGLARHLARTAVTGHFQPGTRGWRSPEHVPGGNPIPASDIFALGILAYVAATAKFPIDPNGQQADYDRRLVEMQAAPISDLRQDISEPLARVIDRSLQRQPARRYLDGQELRIELSELGRVPE